jgi:hypothetical protein
LDRTQTTHQTSITRLPGKPKLMPTENRICKSRFLRASYKKSFYYQQTIQIVFIMGN